MVLIGFATTGPVVEATDDKLVEQRMHLLRENYEIKHHEQPDSSPSSPASNPNALWSLKKTFAKDAKTSKMKVFADVNHSHLCLVGDETSPFGTEVQLRNEVERYASEKFGIPALQFVFGGGPQTVQTTLGFQNAPNAFSCIVKGSGRFCHAIERCLELEAELDQKINKERVGWLLQASMSKPNLSNHEFSQIKSITDNKEKYTSPPLLARRAPPLTLIHSFQSHFSIIFSNSIFQFYFSRAPRFLIFDHSTTDTASIFKKIIKQQVCGLCM